MLYTTVLYVELHDTGYTWHMVQAPSCKEWKVASNLLISQCTYTVLYCVVPMLRVFKEFLMFLQLFPVLWIRNNLFRIRIQLRLFMSSGSNRIWVHHTGNFSCSYVFSKFGDPVCSVCVRSLVCSQSIVHFLWLLLLVFLPLLWHFWSVVRLREGPRTCRLQWRNKRLVSRSDGRHAQLWNRTKCVFCFKIFFKNLFSAF